MSYTFCSSAHIVRKAGAYANSTAAASASLIADFSDQAEGQIALETHRDFISGYSSTHAEVKKALRDTASDLAAIKLINYDLGGYTSVAEATAMIDVLRDNANRSLKLLEVADSNSIKSL